MVNQYTDGNPFLYQQQPQQQQMPQINPLQALQAYQQFSGAGAGTGGGSGLTGLFGGGGAAGGGAASGGTAMAGADAGIAGASGGAGAVGAGGSGGAASGALMSNPIGWIVAAALTQNVLHNKGISSWQAGLKGQAGANVGEHFMDQWGVSEKSPARGLAGLAGWGKGGGALNPSYLSRKIFGDVK